MDGVLTDTEESQFKILQDLLAQRGIQLKDERYDDYIGIRSATFLEQFFPHFTQEEIDTIIEEKNAAMHKHAAKYVRPLPGAIESVKKLNETHTLGIASLSNRVNIDFVVKLFGLETCFTATVSGDDVRHYKPHPEIYETCAEKLGIDAADCVAIEDSVVGVQAAKAAGMRCIAVCSTTAAEFLKEADVVIPTLEDIDDALSQLE